MLVINNDNTFLSLTKKDEVLNIPVAHHDGNYYIDEKGLKELEDNNQILLISLNTLKCIDLTTGETIN